MTLMNRAAFLLAALLPMAAAHAEVRVETIDGKVLVRAAASRLAAWKPDADSIVILAEGAGDVVLAGVPRSLQAAVVEQAGLYGVELRGTKANWLALQQGGQWLLREGKPQADVGSALILKDGWRVAGHEVNARSVVLQGTRWQVAAITTPSRVEGSVVGLIRKHGEVEMPVARREAPAALKPVGVALVSMDEMLARIQPAAGPQTPTPLAAPSGVVGSVASGGTTRAVVPFSRGEKLAAVGTPHAVSETLSVLLSDGLYIPGMVVSLSVPQEFLLMAPVAPDAMPMVEMEADPALQAKLLPQANRVLFPAQEGLYQDALTYALQGVAEADPDSSAERKARVELAGFYLAWERPHEALTVLGLLPTRDDGLPSDPLARLYMGLAQMTSGRVISARVFDQKGVLASDAALWRAVTLSENEDYGEALKEWPQERGVLPRYPDYLREKALLAQASALVRVGDKAVATKIVDGMVAEYTTGKAPVGLVRLQGLVRLGTPQEQAGLQYLADAAEDMRDPAQAYRAKFEFVQALRQRHDLADAQVITYLEDLWLDWRGDDLERDVLGTLADLYDKTNQPREALERWQALVRAYPNLPDINLITERMTTAFLNVFDPESPQTYDLLSYLGLYYDFKELVPNDARGDKVQEEVGRMLSDATLWERAAPVLEQQLNYRPLDPAVQNRIVILLSEVYRREGRAADSLKLLDKWQRVAATNSTEIRQWRLAEGRALLALGRPDSAKKGLATLGDDPEALKLMVEADWRMKNWKGAVTSLQAQLKPVAATQVVSDTGAQLAVFQLAYAYGQLQDGEGLGTLRARFAPALAQLPDLNDGVNAVAAVTGISGVDGVGALAPLTVALADINSLTTSIEAERRDDAKARQLRDEYNKKMQYMELLPPPTL